MEKHDKAKKTESSEEKTIETAKLIADLKQAYNSLNRMKSSPAHRKIMLGVERKMWRDRE